MALFDKQWKRLPPPIFSMILLKFANILHSVTSFRAYTAKHETPTASPDLSIDNPTSSGTDLDYPKHPFSPDLCETITRLPQGFSEVALKRNLSLQTINLLVDQHEQQQQQEIDQITRPPQHHIYAADKLYYYLHTPHISLRMPELERMICIGLLAYTVSASSHSASRASRTHVYDEALQQLLVDFAQYTFFNYEQESLLWVTFCFAGLEEHLFGKDRRPATGRNEVKMEYAGNSSNIPDQQGQGAVHFLHHTIMRFRQSSSWDRIETVLKKFLWTNDRLDEWRESWEACVKMHQPQSQSRQTTPGMSTSRKGNVDGRGLLQNRSPG